MRLHVVGGISDFRFLASILSVLPNQMKEMSRLARPPKIEIHRTWTAWYSTKHESGSLQLLAPIAL